VTESGDISNICTEREVGERLTVTGICTTSEINAATNNASIGVSTDYCTNGAASAVNCDASQFPFDSAAAPDSRSSQCSSDAGVQGETTAADRSKAELSVYATDDSTSRMQSSTLTSCEFGESVSSPCERLSVGADQCGSSCSADTSVKKNKYDSGVHSTAVSGHGNEEYESNANDETSDWQLMSGSSRQTSSLAGAFVPVHRNFPGYGARCSGQNLTECPTATTVGSVPRGGTGIGESIPVDRKITVKSGRTRRRRDGDSVLSERPPSVRNRSPELPEPRAVLTLRLTSSIVDVVCLLQRLIHVADVLTRTLSNDSANAGQRQQIHRSLIRQDQSDDCHHEKCVAAAGTSIDVDSARSPALCRSDAAIVGSDSRHRHVRSSTSRIRQELRQRLVVVSFVFLGLCSLIVSTFFYSLVVRCSLLVLSVVTGCLL
jgi:hypothetical protein